MGKTSVCEFSSLPNHQTITGNSIYVLVPQTVETADVLITKSLYLMVDGSLSKSSCSESVMANRMRHGRGGDTTQNRSNCSIRSNQQRGPCRQKNREYNLQSNLVKALRHAELFVSRAKTVVKDVSIKLFR